MRRGRADIRLDQHFFEGFKIVAIEAPLHQDRRHMFGQPGRRFAKPGGQSLEPAGLLLVKGAGWGAVVLGGL